jgi:hypothetical protein
MSAPAPAFACLRPPLPACATNLLLLLLPTEGSEPYVVPADAGDKDDAFFRVNVLDEELRVMSPDLTAIQVSVSEGVCLGGGRGHHVCEGQPVARTAPGSSQCSLCVLAASCQPLEGASASTGAHSCVSAAAPTHSVCACCCDSTQSVPATALPRHKRVHVALSHSYCACCCPAPRPATPSCLPPQAYRDKESDFASKQSEYAAVTAERDEVRRDSEAWWWWW